MAYRTVICAASDDWDAHFLWIFHYIATRAELEQSASDLFDMVTSGKVKVEVKQRFALKDAAEAHRALEARKTTGSTVLTI